MTYRKRANLILFLSFLCFIASLDAWHLYPGELWAEAALYITQSALIGSVADWFAVTALFEKPLGFPYHTELLHRQRERLTESLAELVSQKLVTPAFWQEHIQHFSASQWLWPYVKTPAGRAQCERAAAVILRMVLDTAGSRDVQEQAAASVRRWLLSLPLAGWLRGKLTGELEKADSPVLTAVLGRLKKQLQRPETAAQLQLWAERQFEEEKKKGSGLLMAAVEMMNVVDAGELARQLQSSAVDLLTEMEEVDSPVRAWLQQELHRAFGQEDAPLWNAVSRWQSELGNLFPLESWLEQLAVYGRGRLLEGDGLTAFMKEQLDILLAYGEEKAEFNRWLDEQVQIVLIVLFQNQQQLIGLAVRQVLAGFSKERFNAFLEDKVGEDLGWIRINGALVGGVLGLVLYGLMRAAYMLTA